MPIYFWNDQEQEKYQKSYFRKFKGNKLLLLCHALKIEKSQIPVTASGF